MSEISGIIKNSVERGWAIDEVRASLLNAGYNPQEVDSEIRALSSSQQSQISQAVVQPVQPQAIAQNQQIAQPQVPNQSSVKFNSQILKNYQTPVVEKQASKTMVILIITLLIICLAAGAALFLFG